MDALSAYFLNGLIPEKTHMVTHVRANQFQCTADPHPSTGPQAISIGAANQHRIGA
jgi:hypothetical protein